MFSVLNFTKRSAPTTSNVYAANFEEDLQIICGELKGFSGKSEISPPKIPRGSYLMPRLFFITDVPLQLLY